MKRLVAPLLLLALLLPATTARAAKEHVDPDAPCFRWPATDWDGDGVFDRIDRCNSTPRGCTVDKWGCTSDADDDGVCDALDQCPDSPAGVEVNARGCSAAQARGGSDETSAPVAVKPPSSPPPALKPPVTPEPAKPAVEDVDTQITQRGRIRLENVYFEPSSARLLPESEESLDRVGAALARYPDLRFEVEGHTDTRGPARFNRRLSQERAEAVRNYLINKFDLDPRQLTAVGYGETRPETDERNDEELLRNRRVELRVLNPDALPGVKVESRN